MEEIYKLIGETQSPRGLQPIRSIVKDGFYLDDGQNIPLINDLDLMLYFTDFRAHQHHRIPHAFYDSQVIKV